MPSLRRNSNAQPPSIQQLRQQIAAIEGGSSCEDDSCSDPRVADYARENNCDHHSGCSTDGAQYAISSPRKTPSRKKEGACEGESASDGGASGPNDEAFKKILRLVNVQERSSKQIIDKLHQAGFTDDASFAACGRAIQLGIVDDGRFARILIESRLRQGKGSAGIESELKRNEIDPSTVEGWPDDFISPEVELQQALELLHRRPPHAKNQREAAYRRLVQKGFPVNVASSAARQWFESLSQ